MTIHTRLAADACQGWALGCCRPGASHLRSGQPCQDAYAVRVGTHAGTDYVAAAVADGHGDARHDRSASGAALAVDAALGKMALFVRNVTGSESSAQIRNLFRGDFPRAVLRQWREMVRADAEALGDAGEDAGLFSRYGTTLLTALSVRGMLLLSQLGDGAVAVVWPDGSVEMPFPDDGKVGGDVFSLSSKQATLVCRTRVVDVSGGALVLVATDGLVNAFTDMEQFRIFVRSLVDRIGGYGLDKVAAALPSWLDGYSIGGSGDDITLALVHIPESSAAADGVDTAVSDEPPVTSEADDEHPGR